jgi:LmbE family N-acetylglucosaminyl deacetylase
MLLTARIPKTWAAALKLAGEHEIIVFDHPDDPSLRWTGEFLDAMPE